MPFFPKRKKKKSIPRRQRKTSSNQTFYSSSRWKKIRKLHKLDNPICAECEKKGEISPAEVTDHVIRMQDGGSPDDTRNLQSLCHRCHNVKSGKERHGYIVRFKLNEDGDKIPL